MRTIPTVSALFAIAIAGCSIKLTFVGGDDDDGSHPSHADAGSHGSGGDFDGGGVYGADAGIYYGDDAGCGSAFFDAGFYVPDAACPGGFGSACIE